MTRAERRRSAREARRREQHWRRWETDIDAFATQAGGMLSIEIVRCGAGRLDAVPALAHWSAQIRDWPEGAYCLGCAVTLRPYPDLPAAFAWVRGAPEPGARSIVSGMCEECARRSDRALIAIVASQLELLWPELRRVNAANLQPGAGWA
jgi:hypothetical protein